MEIIRKGEGLSDPIYNFGTHLLCTKSYGIFGEKGGRVSITFVHFKKKVQH